MDARRNGAKPTINDVAAAAGVSKKTVSRVINNSEFLSAETRQRVEGAIRTLGFVPNPQARALAMRRNMLMVLFHDNPNAQTVLNFQRGVFDAIAQSDLALIVKPVDRHAPDLIQDMRSFLERQRPVGALLLPPISENNRISEMCAELGVRYIRVGSALLDDTDHCVSSNDRAVVAQAVARLLELGHRRIGLIRGPEAFRSAEEREAGFLEALADFGVTFDPAYRVIGTYRFESGIDAGEALLSLPEPPTAIFASNDEMAAGVIHAAMRRSLRVPQDLSVIGFDDSPTAYHIWPSLSTVRWPIYDMGMLAARKLAGDLMPDRDAFGDVRESVLNSTYIERHSVGVPRSSSTG